MRASWVALGWILGVEHAWAQAATTAEVAAVEAAPDSIAEPVAAPAVDAASSATVPAEPPKAAKPKPVIETKFGKGFTVRSDDGDFSLQVRGRVQLQAAVLTQPDAPPDVSFAVRRARLTFRGNLGSRDLEYYVQLGFAPRDMESDLLIPLRDAFVTWKGLRDLNIALGQKKVPFNRERVISSANLGLVDRSITNAEFTLDRDIGVQFSSDDLGGLGGRLGYQIGVFAGDGRNRVNSGPGLLYVGRVQVQPLGAFEDGYVEADLSRDPRARLSLGAGVAFNHLAQRDRSTFGTYYEAGGFNQLHAEGDLAFKCAGFALLGEAIYRRATDGPIRTATVDGDVVTEIARDGLGVMAQAGYLLPPAPIELAVRYAELFPLGTDTALTSKREITGGVSAYLIGHDLKVQADYGWLTSTPGTPGQHQVRLQTQVAF